MATVDGARDALDAIDSALDDVNAARAILGGTTNRLESAFNRIVDDLAPLARAQSVIIDADMGASCPRWLHRGSSWTPVSAHSPGPRVSSDMVMALLG